MFFFLEFAWGVISDTAKQIGSTEVSPPGSPIPVGESDRKISQETQEILKGLQERRYTLARMTSVVDECYARSSFDLDSDENLVPRSRRGSLFPASEFVDDFHAAEPSSRKNSMQHDNSPQGKNPRSRSASLIGPGLVAHLEKTIKEVDES